MREHDDEQMPHMRRPRFLSSFNFGHVLTIGTILVSVTAVIVRQGGQQESFVAAMEAQQDKLVAAIEAQEERLEASIKAQSALLNARVDLVRAELENKIGANTSRIDSQDRFVGAEIKRIREILEDLSLRFDREQFRGRESPPRR